MAEGLDFIEEIRVARFWRRVIGEFEYVNYNAEDLRRWYDAMELRGPEEIRAYIEERNGRHPMGKITGIVATAPHPPPHIVQLWLESHDKVRTGKYWIIFAMFLLFTYEVSTNLLGCSNIPTKTKFQMHPGQIGGTMPQQVQPVGPAPSTAPAGLPQPAQNAARPTGTPPGGGSTSGGGPH